MSGKDLAAMAGYALLAWHVLSLLADAERYAHNVARFSRSPTLPNLVRVIVAEGAVIGDLGWL